jgi:hypothetical protein
MIRGKRATKKNQRSKNNGDVHGELYMKWKLFLQHWVSRTGNMHVSSVSLSFTQISWSCFLIPYSRPKTKIHLKSSL